MPFANPPYALAPTSFRFPALAALAGRAPIGGHREVALAAYVAARLADDTRVDHGLTPAARAERAAHARTWLAMLTPLPSAVRPAILKVMEASAASPQTAGNAVRGVIAVTAEFLDSAARSELDHLAKALEAQALVG